MRAVKGPNLLGFPFRALVLLRQHTPEILLECMAGTTGLEPATSAVTVSQKPVTYWNQEARMATQSTLKNPWNPLLHP